MKVAAVRVAIMAAALLKAVALRLVVKRSVVARVVVMRVFVMRAVPLGCGISSATTMFLVCMPLARNLSLTHSQKVLPHIGISTLPPPPKP